jgi:hypothetical protein
LNKAKIVAGIIVFVIVAYLILMAFMPTLLTIFQSVSATLAARAHIERYIGVVDLVAYLPWSFWFLPAIIGTIAIVIVLKRQPGE